MDFIPPGLFQGVGVLAVLTSMLVASWWLLMRGTIHTDTEFQFVLDRLRSADKRAEAAEAALAESQDQNRILIEANKTTAHVLQGFAAAVESKP